MAPIFEQHEAVRASPRLDDGNADNTDSVDASCGDGYDWPNPNGYTLTCSVDCGSFDFDMSNL